MRYYPLFLNLAGRPCLVVGGGRVGTRKTQGLLASGALVTVVSPKIDSALEALLPHRRLLLKARAYRSSDMQGVFLVFGATDDAELNRRIKTDAAACHTLCNLADQPHLCDFILPAVVARGDLLLAITTAGKSPALAKRLRGQLEAQFGPEYARLIDLLGAIRDRLLAADHDPEGHRRTLNALLDADLLCMLRTERTTDIDALLRALLGPGYDYGSLMAEANGSRR